MRKVKFKSSDENEFTQDGTFLGWGVEGWDEHYGSDTIAIIERPNGEVTTCRPSNIKFVEPTVLEDITKKMTIEQMNEKGQGLSKKWNIDYKDIPPCGDCSKHTSPCRTINCQFESNQMPLELTAENGAKGLLSGEFFEYASIPNVDYDPDLSDEPEHHQEKVYVSWDTIKEIYKTIVKHYTS